MLSHTDLLVNNNKIKEYYKWCQSVINDMTNETKKCLIRYKKLKELYENKVMKNNIICEDLELYLEETDILDKRISDNNSNYDSQKLQMKKCKIYILNNIKNINDYNKIYEEKIEKIINILTHEPKILSTLNNNRLILLKADNEIKKIKYNILQDDKQKDFVIKIHNECDELLHNLFLTNVNIQKLFYLS